MAENKTLITNRQALHDYYIEKRFEAGLQLRGDEVKSLRAGNANLKGSFAKIEGTEIFLHGMHISPYDFTREAADPVRARKLLLHSSEIKQLVQCVSREGYTIVPVKVYFKRGYAKVEIALAKGKKLYDKRKSIKEKEAQRDMARVFRGHSK
ncbi:MAG: SsrA-binding protein SmpB [Candidatus Omnitrophica bacterium]|nr:SsrA-binding protein SmpB [Candidatus Omnitrophota bacterium]MDD5488458.1 SsrA-binding protein SmpB [Candidatus Omnitrophota bacterium]